MSCSAAAAFLGSVVQAESYKSPGGWIERVWEWFAKLCLCFGAGGYARGQGNESREREQTSFSNDRRKAICCVSLRCNYE
eukprot:3777355-Pleurochrysis_carterae.AAC.1